MTDTTTSPRIVNSGQSPWGDHPRFAGVRMKPLLTPADNELANVGLVQVPPGRQVGRHVHPTQVDTVYLLAGLAVLALGDHEAPLQPGSIVAIPIGVPHALRNAGSEPVELIAFFTTPISA
jgi:quercetin dioxygenase-like cupin family protein